MSTLAISDLYTEDIQLYNRRLLKALPIVIPNEFDAFLHEKLKPLDQTPKKYFYESLPNLEQVHQTEYEKYKHVSHFVRSTPTPIRPIYFRDIGIPSDIWHTKINEILSNIPGIRYTWDSRNFQWRVDTADFTPPPEYGKSLQEQAVMRHRRFASYEAAFMSQRILRIYGLPSIQTPTRNQWGRAAICMFADKRGVWVDGVSPSDFLLNVFDTFQESMKEYIIQPRLFLSRLSYLQLFESMTDDDYDQSNPVHRYIFDHYVGRDICSYM